MIKMVKVGDVTEIVSGFAFKSSFFSQDTSKMPLIRIRDIQRGHTETFYSGAYDPIFVVHAGDLLISMDGEFYLSVWQGKDALLNQRVCKISAKGDELLSDYLKYILPKKLKEIEDVTPFVTVKHLSVKKIREIEILLPSLEEQKRVVSILDQADSLRHKRKESIKLLEEYVLSMFVEMFGDPTMNPKKLPKHNLKEICHKITDGTHQPPPFSEKGVPFLFVRNIVHGYIDFDTKKFISDQTYSELTRNVKPERGDILYSTVGSYGKAVWVDTDRPFAFQRHIAHLKPNVKLIDRIFLTAQLNMPFVKRQADKCAKGVAQKTVNLSDIRKFEVIVPSREDQKKYVDFYMQKELVRNRMLSQQNELENQFNALMQETFGNSH